jgi:hypothetical protein
MNRRLVAEPARPEVHADPDPALLIFEQVDVVVAGANRAELVARHTLELADLGNILPERTVKELRRRGLDQAIGEALLRDVESCRLDLGLGGRRAVAEGKGRQRYRQMDDVRAGWFPNG